MAASRADAERPLSSQSVEGQADKRSAVRVACQECRTRKSKCDGGRPACRNCVKKQSPCHYEADPDETRVGALKRKYAELQRETVEHQRFIHLLRETDSDQDVLELVRRVRSGQELSAIVGSVVDRATGSAGENARGNAQRRAQGKASRNAQSGASSEIQAATRDRDKRPTRPESSLEAETGHSTSSDPPSESHSPTRRVSINSLLATRYDNAQHIASDGSSEDSDSSSPRLPAMRSGGTVQAVDSASSGYDRLQSLSYRILHDKSIQNRNTPSGDSTDAGPSFDGMHTLPPHTTKGPLAGVRTRDWDVDYVEDGVFQDIIESFLFWDHPTWAIFDEIAFRDGLIKKGSEYCNKFLVHMIVAFASKIYGTFHPEKVESVESRALAEARKQWEFETTVAIPANIIGALIMNAYLDCSGQHKIPTSYMKQAVFLAHEMGLFNADRATEVYDPAYPKRTRSRAVLAWGLFSHQAYFTCFFNEAPLLTVFPPTPIPAPEPAEDEQTWAPFPLQSPHKPCCSSTRFAARGALWSIANDIVPLHRRYEHRLGAPDYIMNALALYERLRAWHDGLDVRLLRLYDAPPHLFQLHTDYYRGVIELFRPFVEAPQSLSRAWPDETREQAIRVSVACHRQIRFALQELDRQFRDLPLPLGTLTPIVLMAHDTLSHLASDPDNREHIYYFCLCLRMLLRMAETFTVAPIVVQGILQVAKRRDVRLPPEASEVQRLMKQERFRIGAAATINNTVPIDLGLLESDNQGSRLNSIIREMERMEVD